MSEPKRYIPYIAFENMAYPFPAMREVDANWKQYADVKMAYVTDEDYARLKAECQARQAENSVLAVECDSLKAEVERLTKAGDALENWIAWKCESPIGTADGVRDAWDAAKGVQP